MDAKFKVLLSHATEFVPGTLAVIGILAKFAVAVLANLKPKKKRKKKYKKIEKEK